MSLQFVHFSCKVQTLAVSWKTPPQPTGVGSTMILLKLIALMIVMVMQETQAQYPQHFSDMETGVADDQPLASLPTAG